MALVCPNSGARLAWTGSGFESPDRRFQYPLVDGMVLLFEESLKLRYRMSVDTVQAYYRRVPSEYAVRHHVGRPGARAFLDHLQAKLRDFVRPEHAVLEIGSGTGFATEVLLRLNRDPVLADASLEMLSLNHESHPDCVAICCPTEHLPFPDETFDVIFGNNTFYLVPDMDRAVAEIARVLKKGGVLLLSEMNPCHPLWPAMFTVKRRWFERSIYRLFPARMRARFERVGMTIEECDFYSYTPYFAGTTSLAVLRVVGTMVGWARLLRRFTAIRVFYAIRKP